MNNTTPSVNKITGEPFGKVASGRSADQIIADIKASLDIVDVPRRRRRDPLALTKARSDVATALLRIKEVVDANG